jgi:hypothetical protein
MSLSDSMIVLKAKHTWGFHLGQRITLGLEKWRKDITVYRSKILDLNEKAITDREAQALLAQVLYDGTITFQTFKVAYATSAGSRSPAAHRWTCISSARSNARPVPRLRSAHPLGLHNALTRAFKLSTPNVQFNSTVAIGQEFGI